jgi:biopolymer transport protein ExbD
MAGVNVETGGAGARRPLDSEINLIPMIDLLVCCLSFLLITAVWSQMARIEATAQVPGSSDGERVPQEPDKMLHVELKDASTFQLVWRQGRTVISTVDVPRQPVETELNGIRSVRFPDLAARIQAEWQANGAHRDPADPKRDRAVLHAPNAERFGDLVAVIDAVQSVQRQRTPGPAFAVAFAAAE